MSTKVQEKFEIYTFEIYTFIRARPARAGGRVCARALPRQAQVQAQAWWEWFPFAKAGPIVKKYPNTQADGCSTLRRV